MSKAAATLIDLPSAASRPAERPIPADIAEYIERLAAGAADDAERAAYLRAARAMSQHQAGRPPEDDSGDLEEAAALRAAGKARSVWRSFVLVARKYSGDPREIRSRAERLRRKHKIVSTKSF